MNIIRVRFIRNDDKPYGREYSYYSQEKLKVGDKVEVDTRYGESKAIVTEIDVDEKEIESFKGSMKEVIRVIEEE